MKKRKAADENGLVVELLQYSSDTLIGLVADVFDDLIQGRAGAPENWKRTRLKVLLKKADPQMPGNYRPISILPAFPSCTRLLVGCCEGE